MKTPLGVVLITSVLASGMASAKHELEQPKAVEVEQDTHLSWHEFHHELGSYAQIQVSMDHGGVVFLRGHADSAIDKQRVERLARRIRGAVGIRNLIFTD